MAEYKVENLCGFLIRSKLMTPDEMLSMRNRWNAESKDSANATAFVKWLIAKNYTTEYQGLLLSKGHVDDFFLGEYKILERLGRGRMAGVYKAVHPSGQVVAIKVLPPSKAKNAQLLARFEREARLSVKLRHPNIVRSYQVGAARGIHYLVMEYLEGETLDEVLQRRKRFPPQEAVRLIHQALLGLQHIHEQSLVHRDLKPANLMLVSGSTRSANDSTLTAIVKILDIGLAREFFDESRPEPSAELTGEGVLLGTPDYLAPEQARDPRSIDIRADIYSLGCTLYHLLSGQTPFPDKNILTQMMRHASEKPKALQEFNPAIPEGLAQIVNWMMAKKPEERYPTPARAAQALDAYLMVVSEPATLLEDTPQMQNFLSWLEKSEPPAEPISAAKPGSNPGASSATPISIPKMPAASKPGSAAPAMGKLAAPARKRKRRTGVKLGETPVAAPATVPPPEAPPREAPPREAPPAQPITADQIDVELVALPEQTPPKPTRSGLRDVLMIGIGVLLTLMLSGCCWGVSLVIAMLTPVSE